MNECPDSPGKIKSWGVPAGCCYAWLFFNLQGPQTFLLSSSQFGISFAPFGATWFNIIAMKRQ
jgi:hypothetical protein